MQVHPTARFSGPFFFAMSFELRHRSGTTAHVVRSGHALCLWLAADG
jgi:hypothetical protein